MTFPIRILVSAVSLAAISQPAFAQRGGGGPTATCRAPNPDTVLEVTSYQNVVTSTDTAAASFRQRQKLPVVAVSQVSYVTDDAICAKVEAPYSAALSGNGNTPSLQVHVIKVGDVYVVWDPVQRLGEFQIIMTVSKQYKVLAKRSG
jgi:hypothetical protein